MMWLWWKEIIFWHIMRPSRPRLEVDVEGREEEMGVGRSEGDQLLGLFLCLTMENIATYIAPCSPEQILGDREEVARSLDAIRLQREEALRRSQEMSLSFDSTQSEVRGSDKIQGGKGGGCGGWHYHTIQHVLCHYHTGTYVAHSHTPTCTHTHTHTHS